MTMEEINNETNIISILEIQGIKFTSRNFQIEIELKQIMVLDNEPLFDNCLIKSSKKSLIKPLEEDPKIDEFKIENVKLDENKIDENNLDENNLDDNNLDENNLEEFTTDYTKHEDILDEIEPIDILVKPDVKEEEPNEENISLDLVFEDLNEDIEENSDELKEINNIDLSLENSLETIQLKKPNQVYFELYKEARKKAKEAKRCAILAYLEAKNIKKTYMIENMDDSDSEFDAEIDEVSESELEDF
jgi:hypothetical protein